MAHETWPPSVERQKMSTVATPKLSRKITQMMVPNSLEWLLIWQDSLDFNTLEISKRKWLRFSFLPAFPYWHHYQSSNPTSETLIPELIILSKSVYNPIYGCIVDFPYEKWLGNKEHFLFSFVKEYFLLSFMILYIRIILSGILSLIHAQYTWIWWMREVQAALLYQVYTWELPSPTRY